jgi:hypothetical protein
MSDLIPAAIDVLDHVKRALGPTPRRFGLRERFIEWRIPRPIWSYRDDLSRWFSGIGDLHRDGRLTWGHIVQVNEVLFTSGPFNAPGEVIYTESDQVCSSPSLMAPITHALFALKGTSPADPDEARVAKHLTNEYTRAFGMKVPRSITGANPFRLSTIMFCRRHLPNGILSLPYFPLLVSTNGNGVAGVVPSKYWPEEFRRLWIL